MKEFRSPDEILDYAISEEEKAAVFYAGLAQTVKLPGMRELFKQFAHEEIGHKAKLLKIKKGKQLDPVKKKVIDLQLADYLVEVEPEPGMSYQDALILAMKKEKVAYKMYVELAGAAKDAKLKATLLDLAQEEANHKMRFELEYDERIMTEN